MNFALIEILILHILLTKELSKLIFIILFLTNICYTTLLYFNQTTNLEK